jgi:S-adenosylmethionine-diacylglycerol 3-amino-3-carboxypropyl transferase
LRIGAKGLRLIRGKAVIDLFEAKTPEAQAAVWDRHFDDWIWRGAIRMLGRPWFWTKVIGEPGGAFLPSPEETERQLAGAFRRASRTFLFRDSDFASLMLRGSNTPPNALPLHLRVENYAQIRARLGRLSIIEGGLADLPKLGITDVDGFSLSDFGSYCDAAAYASCWSGVLAAASPGAQFCERIFMNALPLPSDQIKIDAKQSHDLTQNDRAIIYEIRAGKIEAPHVD